MARPKQPAVQPERCPHGRNSTPARCSQCLGVHVERTPVSSTREVPAREIWKGR